MIEKTINVKAKASLQPLSKIREISFKYLKSYRLVKKDKDKANWVLWNQDENKNKFTQNSTPINISQF